MAAAAELWRGDHVVKSRLLTVPHQNNGACATSATAAPSAAAA
eukprot:CAMPEP_0183531998 /NCGR_PEP_ID=MMETSP0371-20130417/25218_1 /TAXON_ID=268820 /ORGANISM="Peridinium aciculiferum, Strain PAER-2" /LENGTH=42 /DNA_ID= /DNA_START= /DNA_END= /DNA_ORIENTATION=